MARITGNVQPTIALAEHDDTGGVNTKKALIYGWYPSGPTKVRVQVDADGVIQTSGSSGTQYADGAARGTATGNLMMVDDGTNIQSAAGTTGGLLKVDLSGTTANTTAIKVDGSAVTQPVSGTFWQATQPVSGTFYQATQPVSIATMPSTPVTGTFWQATQPVSGTFWQATQPVSIASMPTTAVTGTFFPAAPSRFADLGANATLNVKASAGSVYSLWCQNENASDRYVQLHNTATTPAGAATPLYTFLISGGDQIVIGTDFFTQVGASFSTGIAFAFSTTKDTYTAGTATDQSTIIHYA